MKLHFVFYNNHFTFFSCHSFYIITYTIFICYFPLCLHLAMLVRHKLGHSPRHASFFIKNDGCGDFEISGDRPLLPIAVRVTITEHITARTVVVTCVHVTTHISKSVQTGNTTMEVGK